MNQQENNFTNSTTQFEDNNFNNVQSTNSPKHSLQKKKISLESISLILFIANIPMAFVPVLNLLITLGTIITTILLIRKTDNKTKQRKLLVIRLCVTLILLLPVTLLMNSMTTVNSSAEDLVTEHVKSHYSDTPNLEYDSSELNAELTDESKNIYTVTGKVWFWKYNYDKKIIEAVYIDVNYVLSYNSDDGDFTLVSDQRQYKVDESKSKEMESAISKIDESKAVEKAEKEFKKLLKSPTSYIRHDYSITAVYKSNGHIRVAIILHYSSQNGFGAMIQGHQLVELDYYEGNYEYVKSYEVNKN